MGEEIERKWLVKTLVDLIPLRSYNIVQGYIVNNKKESVRIRETTNVESGEVQYYLTIKTGSGLVRNETETKITAEQFNILFPLTKGNRVYKNRSLIELKENPFLFAELDVFSHNNGLCLVEVEFPSVEAAERFIVPDWFGKEVTNDSKYINVRLAK